VVEWLGKYHPELFGEVVVISTAEAATTDLKGRVVAGILPQYLAAKCGRYFTFQFYRRGHPFEECPMPEGFGWTEKEFQVHGVHLQEYKVFPVYSSLHPGVGELIDHLLKVVDNLERKAHNSGYKSGRSA
jgi:hypothetical protein